MAELSEKLKGLLKRGEELMVKTDLPDMRWIVPELIPEGFTILAGKAKMGKSYLALAIALDIAEGRQVLGTTAVEPGRVLYITVDEPAENRLRARLRGLLNDRPMPATFDYATSWETIAEKGNRGIALLREYLEAYQGEVRLIVIDVLQKIMPVIPEGTDAYDRIYRLLSPLKDIAQKYHVGLIIVMHKNKSGGQNGDPLDGIYGNTAYGAVADTILCEVF